MTRMEIAVVALAMITGTGVAILSTPRAALAHGMQGGGPQWTGQGWYPGMMGPGAVGPGMMGPGMMGPGMMGPGMMGPGFMGPGMMGPGMMGPGMVGPGMMGPGFMGQGQGQMQPLPQDLSVTDVEHMIRHRLDWQGNPNLKVGKVEEKDENTIIAEIVTKDGSLVQSFEIDRHTGLMQPVQ